MGSSESEVPLLLPPLQPGKEGEQRCGGDGGRWGEATAEAGRLAALAAPMIAVALLQLMMQLISTVMVGHLGEVPLAGAAIANSLTNVAGFSVLVSSPSFFVPAPSRNPLFFFVLFLFSNPLCGKL
jgi:multidrug resistance protein, MATE family